MKTKPILIILALLVLLCGAFLFIRSRNLIKPEKQEVINFLVLFNNQVTSGNIDTALSYFDVKQKTQVLTRLLDVLGNKTGFNGKRQSLFKLALDIDKSTIKIVNTELAEAIIPVRFTNDSIPSGTSSLTLRVHKTSPGHYKIVQIDGAKLMSDYIAYENLIKSKTLSDKDIYSPITLKAFETAKELKTRYDTVIWFAHLDNKTYFYVVKGKWDQEKDVREEGAPRWSKDSVIEPYKMGLVNPELKEIIPAEYDLIHNINGTFPGLIEVEKDGKKGFYDLAGNIAIPVKYDQIFPIEDEINLAVLKQGSDYSYLKKDMTISEKAELKVGDFLSKIKKLSVPSNLYNDALSVITEYNSRDVNGAVYISPSYLVDLNISFRIQEFTNPLRKVEFEGEVSDYKIGSAEKISDGDNWFEASFYSIAKYFVGGRSEFYDEKNIVIVDKKKNRVFVKDINTDYGEGEGNGEVTQCNASSIKAINDSLFEVKAGANLYTELYDSTKTITGGAYYHYLAIKSGKLVELPNNRNFGFTKYIKMDDSYLAACYTMYVSGKANEKGREETLDRITPAILQYMKNEIYADYRYEFKDKRWKDIFANNSVYNNGDENRKNNTSVDDSLTAIDKYNINFINQKLKGKTGNTLAAK